MWCCHRHHARLALHVPSSHELENVNFIIIIIMQVGCSDSVVVMTGQEFFFTAVSSPMRRTPNQYCQHSTQETHNFQPRQAPSLVQSSSLPPDAQSTTSSEQLLSSSSSARSQCSRNTGRAAVQKGPCLFAFPLESNFSGARYAPAVVNQIQTGGLAVTTQELEGQQQAGLEEEEPEAQAKSQSGVQMLSRTGQQRTHEQQQCNEVKAQQAVQELGWEQERGQHQPAATAEGFTGCEEDAGGLLGRAGQSEGARWHVLIDAAKACATAPPDLTKHPADFVVRPCCNCCGIKSSAEVEC